MLSGYLLAEYCPDSHACDASTGEELGELGRCDGRSMWGIITALTLTSPLLILILQVRQCSAACPLPLPIERLLQAPQNAFPGPCRMQACSQISICMTRGCIIVRHLLPVSAASRNDQTRNYQ